DAREVGGREHVIELAAVVLERVLDAREGDRASAEALQRGPSPCPPTRNPGERERERGGRPLGEELQVTPPGDRRGDLGGQGPKDVEEERFRALRRDPRRQLLLGRGRRERGGVDRELSPLDGAREVPRRV